MTDVTVSIASEAEAPACLTLLPNLGGTGAELLIARHGGAFAGAAGIRWVNTTDPPGFSLDVRVLTPWRRRGVGRGLIEAAAQLVDGETDCLWALQSFSPGAQEVFFLEACGFIAGQKQYHFEIDNEALISQVMPLVERLRQRARIPVDAEVQPLRHPGAPLEEIAWLTAKAFGSHPGANLQHILMRREDPSDLSVYATTNNEVVGVVLARNANGVGAVDARATSAHRRNSWASVVVLEAALKLGNAAGVTRTRFFAEENVHDTINVARSIGEATDVMVRYYRPI